MLIKQGYSLNCYQIKLPNLKRKMWKEQIIVLVSDGDAEKHLLCYAETHRNQ